MNNMRDEGDRGCTKGYMLHGRAGSALGESVGKFQRNLLQTHIEQGF